MIEFRVIGRPAPQGSKRHVGGGHMVESSRFVASWRDDVRAAALDWWQANGKPPLLAEPVQLQATFVLARPKSRKDDAWVATAPDLSKLVRSTEDALTGVLLADDRYIAELAVSKVYAGEGEHPGAWLAIRRLTGGQP